MEDNPPPEGDNKLKDRLQEYTDHESSDQNKVNKNHLIYDENAANLKKWSSAFGHCEPMVPEAPIVNLYMEVLIEQKAKKEEVFDKVQKQLH